MFCTGTSSYSLFLFKACTHYGDHYQTDLKILSMVDYEKSKTEMTASVQGKNQNTQEVKMNAI